MKRLEHPTRSYTYAMNMKNIMATSIGINDAQEAKAQAKIQQ